MRTLTWAFSIRTACLQGWHRTQSERQKQRNTGLVAGITVSSAGRRGAEAEAYGFGRPGSDKIATQAGPLSKNDGIFHSAGDSHILNSPEHVGHYAAADGVA
jgi:hypothetical protein